jgi:pimeloyl-ACP methyl ester carboxylesterase
VTEGAAAIGRRRGLSAVDMADDAVAVMDALGWTSAHPVGFSQGGMIAQALAVGHPDRVRSLTSICSTPAPRLGQPEPATLLKIIKVANPSGSRTATAWPSTSSTCGS